MKIHFIFKLLTEFEWINPNAASACYLYIFILSDIHPSLITKNNSVTSVREQKMKASSHTDSITTAQNTVQTELILNKCVKF